MFGVGRFDWDGWRAAIAGEGGEKAGLREVNELDRWDPSVSFAGRRGRQQQRNAPTLSTRTSIKTLGLALSVQLGNSP